MGRHVAPLAALQMLRAVAAWLVVLHHYHQLVHGFDKSTAIGRFLVGVGPYAVEVFFVISGFIMHHSLTLRRSSPGEFLIRRVERIVPAYWVATLLYIACLALLADASMPAAQWDLRTLLLSALFVPHPHLGGFGIYPVLTVGWSLNFEMFFYVLLALTLFWRSRGWLWPVIGVLVALVAFWPSDWPFAKQLASPLLLYFAAGMLIREWQSRLVALGLRRFQGFGLDMLLSALLVAWLLLLHGYGPLPLLWRMSTALDLLTASFTVLMAIRCERYVRNGSFARAMVHLGDASYSTYLVHPLVLLPLISQPWMQGRASLDVAALCLYLVLTLALSLLFHRYVERWSWLRQKT